MTLGKLFIERTESSEFENLLNSTTKSYKCAIISIVRYHTIYLIKCKELDNVFFILEKKCYIIPASENRRGRKLGH